MDDNRDAADSLAELLRLLGHETSVAYDGQCVVKITQTFQPEAVVLDIGMPKIDGYAVVRQLREECDSRKIFVIAMTGYGRHEDMRHALDAGFDAYLVKPAPIATLQELLASIK